MCARYLGFVLLIWFAGVSHAQNPNGCKPPTLDGGYLVPEQDTYTSGDSLTYACNSGLKPVPEGWWATSRCENGKWVDEPQCIDENACLPPPIPHGKYKIKKRGWYEAQSSNKAITVECDSGYVLKDNPTSTCFNATWTSLPVCERTNDSCSEPPKISHAFIIHEYQEVFSAGSSVQYKCEDGYTQKGNDTIVCKDGIWTGSPTCNKSSTDQVHAASDGDVQPENGERRESGPDTGKQPEVGGMDRGQNNPAVSGRQPSDGGRGTTGHQGGSSTTSGSNNRDDSPVLINIQACGVRPNIANTVLVKDDPKYLKYQCNGFYKLAGPDTVTCYSDRTWSELPTCEEAFCVMDPAKYARYGLVKAPSEYMQEGEMKYFPCTERDKYIQVKCTNRRITLTRCCTGVEYQYYEVCRVYREPI